MKHKHLREVRFIERYIMISFGIMLMASGFYFFLIPVDLIGGGVTGLALVINKFTGLTISLFVFIMNILLLLLGWIVLGKHLLYRSIFGSLLFPLILFLFENFVPLLDMDNDFVIATLFGGALLGLGFGYVLKYGGTSGGTDILVKILNKKFRVSVSKSLYATDGLVLLLGVIAFFSDHGVAVGLYSIVTLFISGKVADMVVLGNTHNNAVHIISSKYQEIQKAIYEDLDRGITLLNVKGGYSGEDRKMLVTVITAREYYFIKNVIATIDQDAFVYVTPATEIQGDFITKEDEL